MWEIQCGLCKKVTLLRSRQIANLCINCDLTLEGEAREYFIRKFGVVEVR